MNNILGFVIEFFGLGKREYHYTHNSYSNHVIEYFDRVINPYNGTNNDPYMPRPVRPIITDKTFTLDTYVGGNFDIATWRNDEI